MRILWKCRNFDAMETQIVPEWRLGHRLARALEHGDLSVNEMAVILGVDRRTVSGYIHGHHRPSRATLLVWAERCGVPYEWLTDVQPSSPWMTIPLLAGAAA